MIEKPSLVIIMGLPLFLGSMKGSNKALQGERPTANDLFPGSFGAFLSYFRLKM